MDERNEQEWPQDDDSNVRYTRNQTAKPEGRETDDRDDTIRYGEEWEENTDTQVQGREPGNMNRILRKDEMQDAGDPYSPDVSQKNDWKPDQANDTRQPPDGRRSEKSIHDEAIRRLYDDQRMDASNVYVDVNQGSVRLWGAVASQQEKDAAEEVVRGVAGVAVVHNELQIMQNKPLHTGGPDEQKRPE